ncbi:aminopeptidase [Clostridia bacterium]|nr:aminopeptidase [Clostridia bacterium]
MIETLRKLCAADGVSGDEEAVRDLIAEEISGVKNIDVTTDNLGNLLVFKKGKLARQPKKRVLFAAHMDEVGFIATYIDSAGFVKIEPVGGIAENVCLGRVLRFRNGTKGVTGGKPVHLLTDEEKKTPVSFSRLYLDIGATSKEEAEKFVSPGDTCTFDSELIEFGENFVAGKAVDDRLGCAVMIDMIKGGLKYDAYFAFTVQEEVGTRGAAAAAFSARPDYAVVLEATTAADVAGVTGADMICKLGGGAVVSFMDKSTIYDRELYRLAGKTAKENNLKIQTKTGIAGGNDAGAIHKTAGGIRTIAISAPCRYIHTPECMYKRIDGLGMRILAEKMLEKLMTKN